MSKKYYVIWKGAKTGIFQNWPEVKSYIDGRSDAQYMGFPSKQEAEQAFQSSYTKALMQRSLQKNKSGTSTTKASNIAAQPKLQRDIQIYCDGACSPNPGQAGTGVAVYVKQELTHLYYGLYNANGTNNTAELNGMLEAFKLAHPYILKGQQVEVLSDSKYSIDCITKWAKGWQAKGWTRGKGEPVKNLELVQACYQYYLQLKQHLVITHVKGHADIEGNELSDRMAVYGRTTQELAFIPYEGNKDIKAILAMPSG